MNATILPGPGAKSRASRRDGDGHSIQSVDRALFLLETIAEAGGEATLTDLANRTGLNISTCHHLLATLISASRFLFLNLIKRRQDYCNISLKLKNQN